MAPSRWLVRLALALATLASAAAARADEDSRAPSEAARLVRLGPVAATGEDGAPLHAAPDGVSLVVAPSRQALHVTARFAVDGPAGATVTLALDAPPAGVAATWEGESIALDRDGECQSAGGDASPAGRTEGRAPTAPPAAIGIDPASGEAYLLAPAPPAACARRSAKVTLPATGRGLLVLTTDVDGGYDRLRRRRTFPEVAHLFARRRDYFVYHFAVAGPGGPTTLALPERTDGTYRSDGGVLRVAATEKRHLPIGLTLLGGFGGGAGDKDVRLVGRYTIDLLLPWGDVLAVGGDGDTGLRAGASLTYQLFARWIAFLPIGGHVEAGGILDLWPKVRPGLRVGLGGHFAWVQTQVLLDAYLDAPQWRLSVLTGLGL